MKKNEGKGTSKKSTENKSRKKLALKIKPSNLIIGALIALTVIIVQYWDEICSVINDIKNWFLEQFNAFA